jgi:hypothetical protein
MEDATNGQGSLSTEDCLLTSRDEIYCMMELCDFFTVQVTNSVTK